MTTPMAIVLVPVVAVPVMVVPVLVMAFAMMGIMAMAGFIVTMMAAMMTAVAAMLGHCRAWQGQSGNNGDNNREFSKHSLISFHERGRST